MSRILHRRFRSDRFACDIFVIAVPGTNVSDRRFSFYGFLFEHKYFPEFLQKRPQLWESQHFILDTGGGQRRADPCKVNPVVRLTLQRVDYGDNFLR